MMPWLRLFSCLLPTCCLPGGVEMMAQDKPNILLFIADDVSWNDYGCYGNPGVRTPHIDALAENGLKFNQAYLTASSCSPSRASLITGRYPHNTGAPDLHQPIAAHLPWLPQLLKQEGYYTVLSGKNHMSREDGSHEAFWDRLDDGRIKGNSGGAAYWEEITRQRPRDQPFFFWFSAWDAHRGWDADREWVADHYGPMTDPANVIVPPFLLDTPGTRQDLASYYNEITRFDYFIGRTVEVLKKQAALENTLIFVLGDNGRPFPRAKTRLHDSGMKTALVAHWPKGILDPGTTKSLASAVDLAPTMLEAAGEPPSPSFQGTSLLPIFKDRQAVIRHYAFSEHNWHDYEAFGRSVRTRDWLYLENHRPQQAWQGPADSVRSVSHQELLEAHEAGTLNEAQSDVFLAPRPTVELYQLDNDPDQVKNLAGHPEHRQIKREMAQILKKWMKETGDSVPDQISLDRFDRKTGIRLIEDESFRGETPGESNKASTINQPGPRK